MTRKVIHVDMDVYTALAKRSKPFECPNDVLRRVLGLPEATPKTGRRKKK